jgi:hypothetical protein
MLMLTLNTNQSINHISYLPLWILTLPYMKQTYAEMQYYYSQISFSDHLY